MADNDNEVEPNHLGFALMKAQAEMGSVKFNKENPHFRSRYADLTAIREATLSILHKHGLLITHTIEHSSTAGWYVRGCLLHPASDKFVVADFPLGDTANKPQQAGSAITYGRRYTWSALCGLVTEEDDDANAAQAKIVERPHVKPRFDTVSPPLGEYTQRAANDNRPAAFDFVSWGKALTVAAGASVDPVQLDVLIETNQDMLARAEIEAPKIWERIQKRLDEAYNKFPAPKAPLPTGGITPQDEAFIADLDRILGTAKSRTALDRVWNANKPVTDAMKAPDFDKAAKVYEDHVNRIVAATKAA